MRQAWVRPRFPLGRRYTGEVPAVSPCPMFSARVLPFWVPISAPHQVLGGHRCPSPRTLHWSSPCQPALNVPSQRYYRQQSRAPWGSLLQPAESLHEDQYQGNQLWLLALSLPLDPFTSHPFHSKPKVTEHTTKLCVQRRLTPGPQHYMKPFPVASCSWHPPLLFHDCRVLASNRC